MPVLSPRHSSSLSGSYRSTFSSSLSRPYYGTLTYSSPRITTSTYSERYSTKTYNTEDGKKLYSRHASITEDTRYRGTDREESRYRGTDREENGRSDSLSRDSLSRDSRERSYSSTLSMIDSVADLRNKYSPSNYVPAVLRKDIERSKSINDIGRPPTTNEKSHKIVKKVSKIHEQQSTNPTNNTNDNNDATNGNRTMNSVAEIRKKFDPNPSFNTRKCKLHQGQADVVKKSTKLETTTTTTTKETITITTTNLKEINKAELLGGNIKCLNKKLQDAVTAPEKSDADDEEPRTQHHTSNFASYIPNKEFENQVTSQIEDNSDDVADVATGVEINDTQNRIIAANNDITTSPRLPRSSISQSSTISTNRSSPSTNRTSPTSRASPTPPSATLEVIRSRIVEDRQQGLNGLKNIGNTCFMNSVIQCLSNTKYLMEYVREDGYLNDINTSISSMKGALIKAFSQVLQELWSESSDKVVNTVALKSQIQRFAPRFMGYAQQDAQEFLRYLLEGLHEDVNRVTTKPKPILTEIDETLSDSQKASEAWSRYLRMDNSRVVECFVGQLKSTLRCTHCGHCSVTFDPFWDLSLPIPQRQGPLRLGQCLEHFTREETLDGDEKPTCSKCKERRKCTKSFCIQKFPKILVIHLKRFSPTERFRGKLSLVIDFPLQGLDLSAFAASKSQTESMYNLYAISNHSGTTYSGHYTAYCKHPYSGQWHEYNDSRVSSISSKNVVSSEAYVLFYELINQNSHL